MIHARIQESSSLEGGGSRSIWHIKKALTAFFFYLVLNLFYISPVVTFRKNYHLPRFEWGGTFPGGSNFFQGVKLLFTYRNPYNL